MVLRLISMPAKVKARGSGFRVWGYFRNLTMFRLVLMQAVVSNPSIPLDKP